MTAILHSDGRVEVPVTAQAPSLAGDGTQVLRPGEPGYEEAAAAAVPADQHPLFQPRDMAHTAELDAMFAR